MNTIKIAAFFVGFAVFYAGMFWIGKLAPGSRNGKTDDDTPKPGKSATGAGNPPGTVPEAPERGTREGK